MTHSKHGGCLCGQCRYSFTDAPRFAIQCYCRDCQHVSGAGHLPQFAIAHTTLDYSGPVKSYSRASDAGNDLEFLFCGECGSPLFKTTSKAPDLIFIYPGSLEYPAGFVPGDAVFESGRLPWDAD